MSANVNIPTMSDAWDDYFKKVIEASSPTPHEVDVQRMAFYAGASAHHLAVHTAASLSCKDGVRAIDDIYLELRAFADEMRARAEPRT